MNRLIEDYLRTRGVRYFRGHHDQEYFFLVSVGGCRGRLNVHLEVADSDTAVVCITPDRYYPVALRKNLDELIDRWNASAPGIRAQVHDSSDPSLVGVVVHGESRPDGSAALADFVDAAVGASIELFGAMPEAVAGRQAHGVLRDAG